MVDGVEYGYAFEAITRGQSTWMLAMTFGNLAGGTKAFTTSTQPGAVDVIRTEDNGKTWHFVRSITTELGGAPINESSFAADGDGFLIAARGYEKSQWLLRTDGDFKLVRKVDLAATATPIKGKIGRPRLFTRDGGWYMVCRDNLGPGVSDPATGKSASPMDLSLFKFDPQTLEITRQVLLDNAERSHVADDHLTVWRTKTRETNQPVDIPLALRLDAVGWTLADLVKPRTAVISRFLVHHVQPWGNAPAGSQVFVDAMSRAFTEARKLAEIPEVMPDGKGAPTFHEIRSLSKRLYVKQGGVDTKALLGHATDSSANLYADPRGVEHVRVRIA